MTQYEILLATDGSDCARKAEMAAMKITKSYNIRMAAIYVAVAKKDSEREELVSRVRKYWSALWKWGRIWA